VKTNFEYPEVICPLCGNSLYEFRQMLKCGTRGCPWLEGCCEGATCDYGEGAESK